jgi:hypothetical protein
VQLGVGGGFGLFVCLLLHGCAGLASMLWVVSF